jgi:hypothetical protein
MEELARPDFFNAEEQVKLQTLGVPSPRLEPENRAALGVLMLATLLEVSMTDGSTTTGEFEIVEEFIDKLEREFELTSKEQLEEFGTEMGLVPFIQGTWTREQFQTSRKLLAATLERLSEETAHRIRAAIAKHVYELAKASGGLLKITNISDAEEHILLAIAHDLKLDRTAEGLHLLSRTGD